MSVNTTYIWEKDSGKRENTNTKLVDETWGEAAY